MRKNKVIAFICIHFANLAEAYEGLGEYEDYYSLEEAIRIVTTKLPKVIERDDLQGWHNPHTDYLYESWENL
jgi:hypothetical protein